MFGTRWGHGAEPAEARRIFDGYVEAGVIGPRTRAQLDDNLGALNVPLSAAHLRRLDEESAVPLGFPHEMLTRFEGLGQQIAGGKADLLDAPAVAVP